jgi:hypothetical protein
MSDLYIFKSKVESIFQLLGQKENDISYSVGYSFAHCSQFLNNFLRHLNIRAKFQPDKIKIHLQTHEKDKGFTDFEIVHDGEFHLIVEAKRGWTFPTDDQLNKYASRLTFQNSLAIDRRIIVFNESTPSYTKAHFGKTSISSFPVQVISWQTIQQLTTSSIKQGRIIENSILKNLNKYLDQISTMQKVDSNWVYVVSLGWNTPEGWKINWQDIVNKRRKYFHHIGNGCPAEPPNYIAFRYGGKLQSIHHIDKYEVFTNPNTVVKEIPSQTWIPHYLYHLGEPIIPSKEVKTGKIYPSGKKWAMLDLLLTCDTISDASKKSYEREQHNG